MKHRKGVDHPNWKGGKILNHPYTMIYNPTHPFKNNRGYVMEHRLVMENFLERYLKPNEIVHHIDGNPSNNDISNLKLYSSSKEHLVENHLKTDMSGRICLICNLNKTTPNNHGNDRWLNYKDGFICHKCYMKEYHRIKKLNIK